MKYSHKETVPIALLFNDQLLVDLADIAEEVLRATREHILADHALSEADLGGFSEPHDGIDFNLIGSASVLNTR